MTTAETITHLHVYTHHEKAEQALYDQAMALAEPLNQFLHQHPELSMIVLAQAEGCPADHSFDALRSKITKYV